jgi:integrase/recombinase XerD
MATTKGTKTGSQKKEKGSTKGTKLPPEPLTNQEVIRLIAACSSRAPTGIRNAALVAVLWRCGLRIGECLSLHPKDIDVEKGTVSVLRGKGQKHRIVGIDIQALAMVQRWLDIRASLGINGKSRLFCTLKGKPMSQDYVRQLLPRLGKKAGIEKRVHAHGLRHTHASELRSENVDIGIISKQLGHSSISTTSRYLDHISPQDVIDAMKNREWGNQNGNGRVE